MYTHMLTLNSSEELSLKCVVAKELLILFSEHSPMIRIKFWAKDEQHEHDPNYVGSLYSTDFFAAHSFDKTPLQVDEDGVATIHCKTNKEVTNHFKQYVAEPYFGHALKYFHIEFLNEDNSIQLYCGDFGDDILINIDNFTSQKLIDSINMNYFKRIQ